MYQYLESLDSVRTPFHTAPGADDAHDIARLQIFSDMLMSLVLGREVVVPQSYAFDSWGFHQVAATFLAARDAAGAHGVHPFRLFTFGPGIDTFDDAVASFLRRAGDPDRPFVSSAFPELADRPVATPSAAWLLDEDWLGDERHAAFAAVHRELSAAPPVPARPAGSPVRLPDLLAAFARAGAATTGRRGERAVHDRLLAAVRALDPQRPGVDVRSTLRTSGPWPGDPRGRTAAAIVGGADRLDEVVEFVDTLYNAVVAGSFGAATATFSTGIGTDERPLAARRIAQRLAIAQYRPGGGPAGDLRFEVREAGPPAVAAKRTVRSRMQDLYSSAEDTLPALFAELADDRSGFHRGLRALHRASDARTARAALTAHVTHVDRLLGGDIDVHADDRGTVALGIAIGVAAETGSLVASTLWTLSPALQVLLGGAAAAVGGASGVLATVPARYAARRRAAALLDVLAP